MPVLPDRPCSLVLLNPHAGGGRAARLHAPLRAALQRLADTGSDPAPQLVVAPDLVATLAALDALPGGSRVVLVGGDGTVNRLLPALLRGGHSLALVPAGSGNDTARALGVAGLPLEQALQLALTQPSTPMDVGEAVFAPESTVNAVPGAVPSAQVPFVSSLTAGFDSSVGLRALNGPRWLRGLPRYLVATLREWVALRQWPLRVLADGQLLHDGPLLFASTLNTPTYASGMPVVPHAQTADGRLDVLLTGPFGRVGTLAMLPLLLAGWHLRCPKVQACAFTRLELASPHAVPLAADGEFIGCARQVCVTVRPGALPVVRAPGA